MSNRKHRTRRLPLVLIGLLTFCAVAGGALYWAIPRLLAKESVADKAGRTMVRRVDLNSRLTAGGRVESASNTLIECELETVTYSNEGRTMSASGLRILEVIPEGSFVKTNDVLCQLDASDYEELVRQQELKLRQSKNDYEKAELDVQTAELALMEYRDGTLPQQLQELDSQIVLAKADLERQADRLEWAIKMNKNGYYSGGQLSAERDRGLRTEVQLANLLGQSNLMRKYKAPIAQQRFEMTVANAKSMLSYQELRLRRNTSLLEKFRKQVQLCTVRAPHDGFVIYANEGNGVPKVEVGSRVHQKMDLFLLPDLGDMEVKAVLNETVVDRVRANMTVRVRLEGMPLHTLEGHVVGIAPLPIVRKDLPGGTDVRNYLGSIRLHSAPRGLLPGMSAEVEILTGLADNTLVVPAEAVIAERGHDYCYVDHDGGLERREITIGRSNHELLEVRSGLQEGEQVISKPSLLDEDAVELASSNSPIVDKQPIPTDSK